MESSTKTISFINSDNQETNTTNIKTVSLLDSDNNTKTISNIYSKEPTTSLCNVKFEKIQETNNSQYESYEISKTIPNHPTETELDITLENEINFNNETDIDLNIQDELSFNIESESNIESSIMFNDNKNSRTGLTTFNSNTEKIVSLLDSESKTELTNTNTKNETTTMMDDSTKCLVMDKINQMKQIRFNTIEELLKIPKNTCIKYKYKNNKFKWAILTDIILFEDKKMLILSKGPHVWKHVINFKYNTYFYQYKI